MVYFQKRIIATPQKLTWVTDVFEFYSRILVLAFSTVLWIRMQATYDLRMAERKMKKLNLKPFKYELV